MTEQISEQCPSRNEERFYCKNQNLIHEMLKWKNSAKHSYPVLKMVKGKLQKTKVTDDDYQHEQSNPKVRYFIRYEKTDPRFQTKTLEKNFEFYKITEKYVVEEVTETVIRQGYTFDIADESERTFSETFGMMLMTIGKKVSNHSYFRNYTAELKEDMRAYGYQKVIQGLYNYNFKYTNAFAYITQAFFNSFKSILSQHYKHVNIRRNLTKKAMIRLQSEVPGSSMEKCLGNQFRGNDFDDFSEF